MDAFFISADTRKKRDENVAVNTIAGELKYKRFRRGSSTNIQGKRQSYEFNLFVL